MEEAPTVTSWERGSPDWLRLHGQLLVLAALGVALYWPTCRYLLHYWLSNDYMQFGLLMPPAIAYLVYSLWQEHGKTFTPSPASLRLGAGLLGFSLLVHLAAWRAQSPDISAFSLITFILALMALFWGTIAARKSAPLLAMLILAVPNPTLLFAEVTTWRWQVYSSTLTAIIASSLGLPLEKEGVNLAILGHCSITVAAVCSGCKTFLGLLAFAFIYIGVARAVWWKKGLLVLATAPIAIVSNAFRLVAILIVGRFWGQEAAMAFHDHSGLGLSLTALILLLLLGRWLGCGRSEPAPSPSS